MYNYAHTGTSVYTHTHTYIYIYKLCKMFYTPKSGDIRNYYYKRNGNSFSSNK